MINFPLIHISRTKDYREDPIQYSLRLENKFLEIKDFTCNRKRRDETNRKIKNQFPRNHSVEEFFWVILFCIKQMRINSHLSTIIEVHVESVDMHLRIESFSGSRQKPSWSQHISYNKIQPLWNSD